MSSRIFQRVIRKMSVIVYKRICNILGFTVGWL